METKRAPVKLQDYEKAVHIDASAAHWAQEHARLSAAAMTALSTYQDMINAKNQTMTELCKASGFDMQRAVQARIIKEGDAAFIEVTLHDGPIPGVQPTPGPGPEAPAPPGEAASAPAS
jgi:hypothetical protein